MSQLNHAAVLDFSYESCLVEVGQPPAAILKFQSQIFSFSNVLD